jgi:hypothetical protein
MVLRPKGWTPSTNPLAELRKGRPIQVLQVQDIQQGTQSVFDYLLATLRRSW